MSLELELQLLVDIMNFEIDNAMRNNIRLPQLNSDLDFNTSSIYLLARSLASPLLTACKMPYSPQALLMVCLYQTTSSCDPLFAYSSSESSSSLICLAYVVVVGKTSTRAKAGRGRKARSSGSSIDRTS